MVADLTPLIERLEEAEEGSRELEWALARALGAEVVERHGRIGGGAYRNVPWHRYDSSHWQVLPDFTRSLDDALRLADDHHDKTGQSAADLLHEALNDATHGMFAVGWKPDRPTVPQVARFVCTALLRALAEGEART